MVAGSVGPRQILGVVAFVAHQVEHATGVEAQGEGEADLERAGVGRHVLRVHRVHHQVAVVELVGQPVLPGSPVGPGDAREELRAGHEVLPHKQGVRRRRERGPDHRPARVVQHEAAVVVRGRRGGTATALSWLPAAPAQSRRPSYVSQSVPPVAYEKLCLGFLTLHTADPDVLFI
jgi:hypothetical protein